MTGRSRNRATVWLLVGTGLLLFGAANAHLVYVAMRSQPDCVTHVKPGHSTNAAAGFSAAKSACTPG